MNFIQELFHRRVFQYTGLYFGFVFGVMTFLEWLRNDMVISPYLANLILITLVLLLPSVIILTWVHGRPGKDSWGKIPILVVSANIVAIALLLILKFGDQDLGPVAQTIEVTDETGTVTERVVPKGSFIKRIFIFYPENSGAAEDDWARETISYLHFIDLCQDAFISTRLPEDKRLTLQEAGHPDGHGMSRSLQRKLARDVHVPHFLTSTISRETDLWTLETELHESDSGRIVATRSFESDDLFTLVDQSTRQLREDLDIPSAHLEDNPDLPVSEISSPDLQALRSYILGQLASGHYNDYDSAVEHLEAAVKQDPGFAWAHMLLANIYRLMVGQENRAVEATTAAMENLHSLPERYSFSIKAQYYWVVKEDLDKTLAVVQMWAQVYPNDIEAYGHLISLYFAHNDIPQAVATCEKIMEIDPAQTSYLLALANLHIVSGDTVAAERCFRRYVEFLPTSTVGHQRLANFLTRVGRLEEARQSLETVSLLDPEDLGAALSVINLDIKQGRYADSRHALDVLAKDADTAPKQARILHVRCEIAALMGQTEVLIRTIDEYRSAISEYMNPVNQFSHYEGKLAAISKLGRPQEALSRLVVYESGLMPPMDSLVKLRKAACLLEMGRLDECETIVEEVRIAFTQSGIKVLVSLLPKIDGEVAEARGDLDTAVAKYREFGSGPLADSGVDLKVRLGHVLHQRGDDNEALEHLAEALKQHPAHPEAHLEMARIMLHKGENSQAREHLRIVQAAWADAHPDFPLAAEARELSAEIL